MIALLRKLRGVVGVSLTWGVIWAACGALLGVVLRLVAPQQIGPGEGPATIAAILGIAGAVSGAAFAVTLATLERGRTLLDVSLGRVAAWGAVGGAVIPLLTAVADSQIFWTCPLGALLASSTVAIARRAERRQLGAGHPALPESGS